MATGTYAPFVPQQYFDNNGNPLAGGTITTQIAGTSTNVATYSDVGLTTQNANPIPLNSAGRPTSGAIFLTPGSSYKFIVKDSTGSTLATYDNISAIPGSSSGIDVTGTAGEALTAGQAVYQSAGDGGKTPGSWYKADSANTYSSTVNTVGVVPASILIGGSGTIRLSGAVTGLSSLTIGARYYVGTAGALTATAPANARFVGQADTTSSLVVAADPPLSSTLVSPILTSPTINTSILSDKLFVGVCQGRLTLTTVTPVTTADVTAATTVFFTPYAGSNIALYDGSAVWTLLSFAEISIAVPATTSQMYDVFVFNNSGVAALELLAWTNDTTRATALVLTNGVLTKTGATTRRYVGSVRTTTVSGQTEDSVTNRYVWNYYNRGDRPLQRLEATTSWTYNSVTPHQANASASNQVNFVVGVSEDPVEASVETSYTNPTSSNAPVVGVGLDSTSAFAANQSLGTTFQVANSGGFVHSQYRGFPGVGKHTLAWLEAVVNSGTAVTFVSNTNSIGGVTTGSSLQSGLLGRLRG